MNGPEYIPIRVVARLKGKREEAALIWCKRHHIIPQNDPKDGRRKLFPASVLTPDELRQLVKEQVTAALQGMAGKPDAPPSQQSIVPAAESGRSLQPSLAFAPPSPSEAARDAIVAGVPKAQREYVDRWMEEISQNINGTWKVYRGTVYNDRMISCRTDFIHARAALHGVSFSTYNNKLLLARGILRDPAVPKPETWRTIAEALVPRPRPGRSRHNYFADPRDEVAWQFPALRGLYLNQARLSVPAAFQMLLELIDRKQRAWGMGKLYPRPTLAMCRTALAKISEPELILAREGMKPFNDRCAPYISRTPPERSGQVVSTDQKHLDIICRDQYWNVGRIWTVNFVDVASERWLGGAFGPVLSGDMVMEAAAMMLERCVPEAVQFDRGKEFVGTRFAGGCFKISGERYYAESMGLWERLGVKQLVAIGRNPQTKPIERWHRNLRPFEQLWPTWTGSNPGERPERLGEIEKQVALFKQGKAPAPAVPSIEQVIRAFLWWAENVWNGRARGNGRYRRGLTPDEAWNVKAPEGGHRKLSASDASRVHFRGAVWTSRGHRRQNGRAAAQLHE